MPFASPSSITARLQIEGPSDGCRQARSHCVGDLASGHYPSASPSEEYDLLYCSHYGNRPAESPQCDGGTSSFNTKAHDSTSHSRTQIWRVILTVCHRPRVCSRAALVQLRSTRPARFARLPLHLTQSLSVTVLCTTKTLLPLSIRSIVFLPS